MSIVNLVLIFAYITTIFAYSLTPHTLLTPGSYHQPIIVCCAFKQSREEHSENKELQLLATTPLDQRDL